MNQKEYLLVQAASECMEVAHRITKALHFGLDEVQPGQDLTNADRIAGELVDLFATLEMLEDAGHISNPCNPGAVRSKKAKVAKFMAYAQTCGTLDTEPASANPAGIEPAPAKGDPMNLPPLPEFEGWLKTVCFQRPTPEAYDLARDAWLQAQREAVAAAVPEGWRLVPIDPTDEMLNATYAGQHCSDVWRDMLAAAPGGER